MQAARHALSHGRSTARSASSVCSTSYRSPPNPHQRHWRDHRLGGSTPAASPRSSSNSSDKPPSRPFAGPGNGGSSSSDDSSSGGSSGGGSSSSGSSRRRRQPREAPVQMAEFADVDGLDNDGAGRLEVWEVGPSAEEVLLLQSAIDKTYRRKLREFRSLLNPETLGEMRASLAPEDLPQLESILADVHSLPLTGSMEEEEGAGGPEEGGLTPEEQEAWERLQQQPQLPHDFDSYLASLLPEGLTPEQLQELLGALDPALMGSMRQLYGEMQEFEVAEGLDMDEATARYAELSRRMGDLMQQLQDGMEDEEAADVSTRSTLDAGAVHLGSQRADRQVAPDAYSAGGGSSQAASRSHSAPSPRSRRRKMVANGS